MASTLMVCKEYIFRRLTNSRYLKEAKERMLVAFLVLFGKGIPNINYHLDRFEKREEMKKQKP
jgi:hypothetical protein